LLELFSRARFFFTHFSSVQKTLEKCGFLACSTRAHVNGSRLRLLRSTRSFDAAESSDDRRESAAKFFLDNIIESHLDRAVEDRNRANRSPTDSL